MVSSQKNYYHCCYLFSSSSMVMSSIATEFAFQCLDHNGKCHYDTAMSPHRPMFSQKRLRCWYGRFHTGLKEILSKSSRCSFVKNISNIIYKRTAFGTKQHSSKFKFFTVGVDFLSSPFVMRKQVQKSHLFTRKILLEIFPITICAILHDSLPFIQFFRLYPKKIILEEFRFQKAQMQRFTNKIFASNENSYPSNAERNANIANKFSFLLFFFQTVNRDVKNLFNSEIPYIQG